MLTVISISGTLAAGLGVVDFTYLEQHHHQYAKAVATYQNDIKQYRSEFMAQEKKLTEPQKQQLIQSYNAKLDQNRIALFGPIDQDIVKQIKNVKNAKGLTNVAVKGYVIDGDVVDITNDVAQQLK